MQSQSKSKEAESKKISLSDQLAPVLWEACSTVVRLQDEKQAIPPEAIANIQSLITMKADPNPKMVGHYLTMISEDTFKQLKKPTRAYVYMDCCRHYCIWGCKDGKWMLTDLKQRIIPLEWHADQTVFISPEHPMWETLKRGHLGNQHYQSNETTLHLVAQIKHPQAPQWVKLLLDNKANADAVNESNKLAIQVASDQGNFPVVQRFLELKSVNTGLKSKVFAGILWDALYQYDESRKKIVEFVIADGFDTQKMFRANAKSPMLHPIHLATQYASPAIVESLLKCKIDPNLCSKDGNTPLNNAMRRNDGTDMITLLLDSKADTNLKNGLGSTLLHFAGTRVDYTTLLIKAGAELETCDSNGDSPLHLAIKTNQDMAVPRCLIEHKAKLNAVDKEGNTALHLYLKKGPGELSFVSYLIEQKADLHAKDASGQTPLFLQLNRSTVNPAITSLLIEKKSDINTVGVVTGNTPLHLYLMNPNFELSESLITKMLCLGANYEAVNKAGQTAVQCIPKFPELPPNLVHFVKAMETTKEVMKTFHMDRMALVSISPLFRTRKGAKTPDAKRAQSQTSDKAPISNKNVFTVVQQFLFGEQMTLPGMSLVEYDLSLVSIDFFNKLPLEQRKGPYLIKNSDNHYQIWGDKKGEWQLTDLVAFKMTSEWKEGQSICISPKHELWETLKRGHNPVKDPQQFPPTIPYFIAYFEGIDQRWAAMEARRLAEIEARKAAEKPATTAPVKSSPQAASVWW